MNKGFKILLILAVAAVALAVGKSFTVINLSERAIVVGIGIDFDTQYEVTVEIIVPQSPSGESAAGGAKKTVSGKGETVGLALRDLYNSFGQTPSFGECCIIVLGKDCAERCNLKDSLNFFYKSDAFKDGTLVAVFDGKAGELFERKTQIDEYISFALETLLLTGGKRAQIPHATLNDVMMSQKTASGGGFVNLITFKDEQTGGGNGNGVNGGSGNGNGGNGNEKPKEGKFVTDRLALFKQDVMCGEISRDEISGYNLFNAKKAFTVFLAEIEGKKYALGVVNQHNKTEYVAEKGGVAVKVEIKIKIKEMATDTTGDVSPLLPKLAAELPPLVKKEAERQAAVFVRKIFDACAKYDCDILKIRDNVYAKYGQKAATAISKEGEDFWNSVKLDVTVKAEG